LGGAQTTSFLLDARKVCVCVSVRETGRERVCVCERERERERVSVCEREI